MELASSVSWPTSGSSSLEAEKSCDRPTPTSPAT